MEIVAVVVCTSSVVEIKQLLPFCTEKIELLFIVLFNFKRGAALKDSAFDGWRV